MTADGGLRCTVDGIEVALPADGTTLLDVLRDQLGIRSVKDGCSPQGQCGCCTVWVDGAPRVSCVTPARRVAGREVTTLDGLPDNVRQLWADALVSTGGSQCGFCTPGIIMRLAAVVSPGEPAPTDQVERGLAAHLCRCTGWQTIVEAAEAVGTGQLPPAGRDLDAAARRATLEGQAAQRVGPGVALGDGGFADDSAPAGALVAVPDAAGGYAIGSDLAEARRNAGTVQGRRSTVTAAPPLPLPAGSWDLTLQTSWVEPAYLEPDASWCDPGGAPAAPLGNGGAFGGKVASPVAGHARALADRHGRPVRVLWRREDVVRRGPKRPPVAGGIRVDGTGVLHVGAPPGVDLGRAIEAAAAVAPGLTVERVELAGPAASTALRAAVWAEAAILARCASVLGVAGPGPHVDVPVSVTDPTGGSARVRLTADGTVDVEVEAGDVLDLTVLRSYCIGSVHQALGWVTSEGVAVDADGTVLDLTVRSFGVVPARAMPTVRVHPLPGDGPPRRVSDAVFAAAAAAFWLAAGLAPKWPVAGQGT